MNTGLIILALLMAAPGTPDAEVLMYNESMAVTNARTAVRTVSKTIRVNNSAGEDEAEFFLGTDEFSNLESFSGELTTASGKKVKIKEKDCLSTDYSSGLATGTHYYLYTPNADYPYTVTYSYKVSYKNGLICYPSFSPVSSAGTSLKEARYELSVPADFELLQKGNVRLDKTQDKGKDIYSCHLTDIAAVPSEQRMPSLSELLPYCRLAPKNFVFAGYSGCQSSWSDVAQWIDKLNSEVETLPEEVKRKVHELTSGTEDDLSKIRILYDYLKRTTRYVSIQLGIGGYRPASPEHVFKNGFGDCKGLSNYMKLLLAEAGVRSEYVVLSAGGKVPESFSSMGAFNHAMLCVPSERDTLWLECTNQNMPLGYRHDDMAGQNVLLISKDTKGLVRIPSYTREENRQDESIDVIVNADGSAEITGHRITKAREMQRYIGFKERTSSEQNSLVTSPYSVPTENMALLDYSDNFNSYEIGDRAYIPYAALTYRLTSPKYSTRNRERIFVPASPVQRELSYQKAARVNDFIFDSERTLTDTCRVTIPIGYDIEALPAPVNVEFEGMRFSFESQVTRDSGKTQVVTTIFFTVGRGRYPAERYNEYRDFAKSVNRCADATIVLLKKN